MTTPTRIGPELESILAKIRDHHATLGMALDYGRPDPATHRAMGRLLERAQELLREERHAAALVASATTGPRRSPRSTSEVPRHAYGKRLF